MYYELCLPYFKQGDDLSHCIEETENTNDAITMHISMLQNACNVLSEFKTILKDFDEEEYEIGADTHHIGISTENTELATRLEKSGSIQKLTFEDEEEDEDEVIQNLQS